MPIGKKKTALIDANRKKPTLEDQFPTKLNDQKIWISNDATDCIQRIRSLTIFRLRPFRIKCEQQYSSENTFLFRHIPKLKTLFVLSCNQSRLDIRNLNTEGVNTASQIKIYNKKLQRRQVTKSSSSYEKVNDEDSQLKKKNDMKQFKISFRTTNKILKKKTKVI